MYINKYWPYRPNPTVTWILLYTVKNRPRSVRDLIFSSTRHHCHNCGEKLHIYKDREVWLPGVHYIQSQEPIHWVPLAGSLHHPGHRPLANQCIPPRIEQVGLWIHCNLEAKCFSSCWSAILPMILLGLHSAPWKIPWSALKSMLAVFPILSGEFWDCPEVPNHL